MFYVMRHLISITAMFDMDLAEQYDHRLAEHLDVYIKRGGRLPE